MPRTHIHGRDVWLAIGIFAFSFLFVMCTAFRTSPFSQLTFGDYSVFRTVALYWLDGTDLYADIFDNKGPYHLLFYLIGMSISTGKWGIFLLECLTLTIVLWLLLKTAQMLTRTTSQIVYAMVLTVLVYYAFADGGGTVEMVSLPFATFPVYLWVKYLKSGDEEHRYTYTLIYGICFGIISFMRINNNAIIVGIVLGLAYTYVRKGLIASLARHVGVFILGITIGAAPALIYFWAKGTFSAMIYDIFQYNLAYRDAWDDHSTLVLRSNIINLSTCLLLIPAAWRYQRATKMQVLPGALGMAAVTFLTFVGGTFYYYYFLMTVPLALLTASFCADMGWWQKSAVALFFVLLTFYSARNKYQYYVYFDAKPQWRAETFAEVAERYPFAKAIMETVPEEDYDKLYVYDEWKLYSVPYYIRGQYKYKYFILQTKMAQVTEEMRADIIRDFTSPMPKWLISYDPIEESVFKDYAPYYIKQPNNQFCIYKFKEQR